MNRRRANFRERARAGLGVLGFRRAPYSDPAEGQQIMIEGAEVEGMFGDPVAENLTGAPARVFYGETASPQIIITSPNLSGVDPVIGVSPSGAGRYPSLPSRRPPANTPVP